MRGVIVVETQAEYDKWMAQQKPDYFALFPDKNPDNKKATDTAVANKPLAQLMMSK
jgi:cytochrome c oxidase subunit 2